MKSIITKEISTLKDVVYVFDLPVDKLFDNTLLQQAIKQNPYIKKYIDELTLGSQQMGLMSCSILCDKSIVKLAVCQWKINGEINYKAVDEFVDNISIYGSFVVKKPIVFCGKIFDKPEVKNIINKWFSARETPYFIYIPEENTGV